MAAFAKWDPVAFPGRGCEGTERRATDGLSVFRYWIERKWSDTPGYVLWVMFNPSVATIESDGVDRAAPLCFQRSQRIALDNDTNVGAMRVVNLFARRATDTDKERWPNGSALEDDLWVGSGNNECIKEQACNARLVIAAWGAYSANKKGAKWRADDVESMLSNPWCLDDPGTSHPYYAGQMGARADAGIVRLGDARKRDITRRA